MKSKKIRGGVSFLLIVILLIGLTSSIPLNVCAEEDTTSEELYWDEGIPSSDENNSIKEDEESENLFEDSNLIPDEKALGSTDSFEDGIISKSETDDIVNFSQQSLEILRAPISLGQEHSAAINSDGTLWLWGLNSKGQLGNGTTENQEKPIKIMDNVLSVSLGDDHSGAIKEDGTLWLWGDNYNGKLGNGTTENSSVPIKIMDNVVSVSLGSGDASAAIKEDGTLWTWGTNRGGMLGNGTTKNSSVPIKIMDNVVSVSMGDLHCAAIKADGTLWMWGANGEGQLGNGEFTSYNTPIKIMDNVSSVNLGSEYSAAIKTDGTLWTWGYNWCGKLGRGESSAGDRSIPVKIMDNVATINLGYHHAAAIKTDGTLWTWGRNWYGQLGDNTISTWWEKPRPTPIKIMDEVATVSLGNRHSAAMKTDGTIWMWGNNEFNKLGIGHGSLTPVQLCLESTTPDPNPSEPINSDQYIIDRVKKYTSDVIWDSYKDILLSEESQEVKFQRLTELFQQNGLLDVKVGTAYLKSVEKEYLSYAALTSNTNYLCYNVYELLQHKPLIRSLLVGMGLIYNYEIWDYVDIEKNLNNETPAVTKYKDMLYDFMDKGSLEIERMTFMSYMVKLSNNVTTVKKELIQNKIKKINKCRTEDELWSALTSAEMKNIFTIEETEGSKMSYNLNEGKGFGRLLKEMGGAIDKIELVNISADHVIDFIELDGKLKIYNQYRDFLEEVKSAKDLPGEMRVAAAQVLKEMDEGEWKKLKEIAWDIADQMKITSTISDGILEMAFGKAGVSFLSELKIATWFSNHIVDAGGLVKNVSDVEGYAILGNYYQKKLESYKNEFLSNQTAVNAWKFYENYSLLHQLRINGEQAVLKMNKVKGIVSLFTDYGYKDTKEVVEETLWYLDNEWRFSIEEGVTIPDSVRYATKAVVSCPVNVEVYASDGTKIATLLDGTESDITNEHGRFAVVYRPYTGEYAKVIFLNQEHNYTFKIVGVGNGLVDFELAQAKDAEAQTYTMANAEIKKNGFFQTSINQVVNDKTYDIDTDGDGTVDKRGNINVIKGNDHVAISSIDLDCKALQLKVGDESVLNVSIAPTTATRQNVEWLTSDKEVVTIKGGKVTAIGKGTAKIYCFAQDNMELKAVCDVTVKESGSPQPEPPKLDKLTANELVFIPPSNLEEDGNEKTASVGVKDGIIGIGKITIKYYNSDTLLQSAPSDLGTYTVKVDVSRGSKYEEITDLVLGTFTVVSSHKNGLKILEDPTTGIKVERTDGTEFEYGIQLKVTIQSKDDINKLSDNIDEVAKGFTLVEFYNIQLLKNNEPIQMETKLNIIIPLSKANKELLEIKAVHVDNDEKVTIIPGNIIDNKFIFMTDHLSKYGLIGKVSEMKQNDKNTYSGSQKSETKEIGGKPGESEYPTSPDTGDHFSFLFFTLMILSGIVIIVAGLKLYKNSKST